MRERSVFANSIEVYFFVVLTFLREIEYSFSDIAICSGRYKAVLSNRRMLFLFF